MIELARREYPQPGPFPLTRTPAFLDDHRTARAVCPNGHVALLTDHEIADDGTVTPSVVCDQGVCDWHEDIQLMDWNSPSGGIPEPEAEEPEAPIPEAAPEVVADHTDGEPQ